jgi:ATP-dependent DNA helicase RecG
VDFRDIREFNGNIIECIDAGVEYLNSKMDWRAEIDGVRRREIPEVPMEAIREIVTNSFCHRRYG